MTPSPSATSPGNSVKYIINVKAARSQFGLTAFKAYETLIEIGYQVAKEAIKAWLDNKQAELDIVSSPSGQH